MNVSTNQGNPNALKLIIAAKLAQEPVTVKFVKLKGESLTFLSSPSIVRIIVKTYDRSREVLSRVA